MKKIPHILTPVLFLFLFYTAGAQHSSNTAMSTTDTGHVIFNEADLK